MGSSAGFLERYFVIEWGTCIAKDRPEFSYLGPVFLWLFTKTQVDVALPRGWKKKEAKKKEEEKENEEKAKAAKADRRLDAMTKLVYCTRFIIELGHCHFLDINVPFSVISLVPITNHFQVVKFYAIHIAIIQILQG